MTNQQKIEGMREIMTIVREHKTEVGQWVIQDLLEKIKQAITTKNYWGGYFKKINNKKNGKNTN